MSVKTQPVKESQVSVVQTLLSLQMIMVCVHPEAASHPSAVQVLLSLQFSGVYVQTPLLQASLVQMLLSSQFAICRLTEQVFVHPLPSVTVTEYVPGALTLPVLAVAAENPLGPDQEYDVPPEAVNVVACEGHIVLFPLMLHDGALTVSVREHELVHPSALVTVTI